MNLSSFKESPDSFSLRSKRTNENIKESTKSKVSRLFSNSLKHSSNYSPNKSPEYLPEFSLEKSVQHSPSSFRVFNNFHNQMSDEEVEEEGEVQHKKSKKKSNRKSLNPFDDSKVKMSYLAEQQNKKRGDFFSIIGCGDSGTVLSPGIQEVHSVIKVFKYLQSFHAEVQKVSFLTNNQFVMKTKHNNYIINKNENEISQNNNSNTITMNIVKSLSTVLPSYLREKPHTQILEKPEFIDIFQYYSKLIHIYPKTLEIADDDQRKQAIINDLKKFKLMNGSDDENDIPPMIEYENCGIEFDLYITDSNNTQMFHQFIELLENMYNIRSTSDKIVYLSDLHLKNVCYNESTKQLKLIDLENVVIEKPNSIMDTKTYNQECDYLLGSLRRFTTFNLNHQTLQFQLQQYRNASLPLTYERYIENILDIISCVKSLFLS